MRFSELPATGIVRDQNQSLYHIPEYQREYSWGTTIDQDPQVIDLWNDLWDRCWKKRKKHFIGTVVCSSSKLNGADCFDIVDGQQRVTTLFLLSIAVRDFLKEHNQPEHQKWTQAISKGDYQCRLVLSDRYNQDRSTLNHLLAGNISILEKINSEQNRMMAAYRLLRHSIFTEFENEPARAHDFADNVLQLVFLLFVVLEPTDDAATIWKTLNDRGRQIDEYEKIRSSVLIAGKPDPNICDFALKTWTKLETTFDEIQSRKFLDAFASRHGYKTIRHTTYEEIQQSIMTSVKTNSFPNWLHAFSDCLNFFYILLEVPNQRAAASGLIRLEIESLQSCILAIVEKEGLSSELLTMLENIAVRHLVILDKPTNRLNRLNRESCNIIGKNSASWKNDILGLWKDEYSVTDTAFRDALIDKKLYGPGITRRRLFYILERIENSEHKEGLYSFVKECTIEHIIPQTLSDDWTKELIAQSPNLSKTQFESLYEARLHTLGNLTVLMGQDQPVASNHLFESKVAIYHKIEGGKPTYLNSYFKSRRRWGLKQVETRSRELASIAVKIWPKPL